MSQQVTIRLLPDKSGRVLIHWFEHIDDGPIKIQGGVVMTALGPMRLGGAVGRIACQPALNTANARMIQGYMVKECYSDEVRAVTCPKCKETEAFKRNMAILGETLEQTDPAVTMQRLHDLAKSGASVTT